MAGNTGKEVTTYAFIGFSLLAVLFGMQIMTFIFGQLGPSSSGLTVANPGYNESLAIQNASLQAIKTYANGSSTQFNVLQISITLILLVGVFLFFWKTFMAGKGKGNGGSGMGGTFG